MNNLENNTGTITKIYGNENLKEILSEVLEKIFIEKIKNVQDTTQ